MAQSQHTLTLVLMVVVQSTCHMEISLAWDLPRGHANHFGLVLCVYISKSEELEVPSYIFKSSGFEELELEKILFSKLKLLLICLYY